METYKMIKVSVFKVLSIFLCKLLGYPFYQNPKTFINFYLKRVALLPARSRRKQLLPFYLKETLMYSYWTIFIVRSLVYGYFGLDYARHDPIFGVFHRLIGNRFLGVFLSSYILSYLAVDYLFYLAPNRLSGATLKELLLDLKCKFKFFFIF